MTSPKEEFTVASSAASLRQAARVGEIDQVSEILARYAIGTMRSQFLPAVLAARDPGSGNTAAHYCSANGHDDVLQLLLKHGAPIDTANASGSTPLHYAAVTGNLSVIRQLLRAGARAVVENNFSRTALDEAVSGRHEEVAKFLMDHVSQMNPEKAEESLDDAALASEDVSKV